MFKLKSKAMLAPMAGVSDIAFRTLCRRYGSAASITEFLSIEALTRNNPKTLKMMRHDKEEDPFCIQLFGSDVQRMKLAVQQVQDHCDWIDLNLGCPATKVVDQGAGSALLEHPDKVKALVATMVKHSQKPITCKIRIGASKEKINAVEIAKLCEAQGAQMIAVHGRTRSQAYKGKADWDVIKDVVDSVYIPVIGNGDITSPEIAKEKLKTGCEYLQIGRGAMGNPYLFTQVNDYLKNNKYEKECDKKKLFKEYLALAKKYDLSLQQIRIQAMYFSKGLKGAPSIRREISKAKEIEEIENII